MRSHFLIRGTRLHVRHVLAKLVAENRAQAALRALARGVVSPEDLAAD